LVELQKVMKTKDYNPSILEVRFVDALNALKNEITAKLIDFEVTEIHSNTKLDNPTIEFVVKDRDGDPHALVVKVIQKPDQIQN